MKARLVGHLRLVQHVAPFLLLSETFNIEKIAGYASPYLNSFPGLGSNLLDFGLKHSQS